MPLQPIDTRPNCSFCCKPFTAHDPGLLVESHKYLGDISAPQLDPTKPTCVMIQLAPDRVLCRECCAMFGYSVDPRTDSGVAALSATRQAGRTGESVLQPDATRPPSVPEIAVTPGRSLDVPIGLADWALALEHDGAWHLFKRFRSAWRHQGKARGITKGRQADLLRCFAEGSGLLSDDRAIKLVRKTTSKLDQQRIMHILKPAISRLRKVIRQNFGVTNNGVDPLPRDKHAKAWQAAIQIGYAIQGDQDRLEFKLREQLSGDETLDVLG